MSSAAQDQWFYSHNGQQLGPVPLERLRAMLSSGEVGWTELVWTNGMANWAPASIVSELRPLSTSPGDRPPPLPPLPTPQAINYGGYAMPPPPGQYQQHDIGADPKMRMLLPVGRSPWAIIAGYLGLLSPLMIFAPFALIVSIMAIRDIKRRDTHGMGRAVFGLIMGAIFSIILCIGIVVLIVNPK